MKTAIITILMLAILVQVALAEICEHTREINENCTMLTPSMNCDSYTYQVFNLSGNQAQQGLLTKLNASLYQFNLTVPEGDYIVQLCDNSTREIRVTQGDDSNMIIAALILIPMLFAIVLIIWASILSEEHATLKIFLSYLTVIPFFTSLHFGMISIAEFYNFPALEEAIGTTVYWAGWIFVILIVYVLIYATWKGVAAAAQAKKERVEY